MRLHLFSGGGHQVFASEEMRLSVFRSESVHQHIHASRAQRVRRRRLPTAAHTVPASVCTVADTEVHVASLRRTSESADSQHRRVPSIGRSYDRSPEITAERTRQAVTESHLRRWPSGPLRIVCAETAVLPSKPLRLNLPLTIRWFTGE